MIQQQNDTTIPDTAGSDAILEIARNYIRAGLSVIPIRADGSKAPIISEWKPYQETIANNKEIHTWFANDKEVGIGIIGGGVSGGLEILDNDDPSVIKVWADKCIQAGLPGELLSRLIVVQTPSGGWHFYYRCLDVVEGSKKLAQRKTTDGKIEPIFETKARGGYVLAPGCPANCHPDKKIYQLKLGNFDNIPVVTREERQIMHDVAASFNEYFKEAYTPNEPKNVLSGKANGLRPGDDFNARADWRTDVLVPNGCKEIGSRGEESFWIKPNSNSKTLHATLNHQGSNRLYIFSTSFLNLDAGHSYNKFQAYTYLAHGGDFTASAKTLAAQGYGSEQVAEPKTPIIEVIQARDLIVPRWPQLKESALPQENGKSGLIREFIEEATRHSEADPAAVLFTLLPALGIVLGADTYFEVGDTKHPARLNTLIVGATSRARKGTSAGPVETLLEILPLSLSMRVTPGPIASGEGLIYHVRDASEEKNQDGQPIDPGILDKRLLVIEPEYGRAFRAMNKEHSTLATTIRAAFDRGNLDPLTKHNRIKSTGAHIGIVGHITQEELKKELSIVEIFSGTMNRSLIGCARRSKEVSRPLPMDKEWLGDYIQRLTNRLTRAQKLGGIDFSDDAGKLWDDIYPVLTKDEPGLLGALTCRSEALTIRVALEYALLADWKNKPVIQVEHLLAAGAVIDYSNDSARYLYGNPQADKHKDKLCQRILKAVAGSVKSELTQTQIHEALGKKISGDDLRNALNHLQSTGKLTQFKSGGGPGKGAPTTTWKYTEGFRKDANGIDGNDGIGD